MSNKTTMPEPDVEALEALIEALEALKGTLESLEEALKGTLESKAMLAAPQPVPDIEKLVEALEAALMVMTSKEVRLEKQEDAITMARAALAAHRKQKVSHDWDDQDKCRRCGDRDWYASATCTPKQQPASVKLSQKE